MSDLASKIMRSVQRPRPTTGREGAWRACETGAAMEGGEWSSHHEDIHLRIFVRRMHS